MLQERIAKKLSSFDKIHWLRFSIAFFALMEVAAHLFASPGATPQITFWLETEVAFYIIISVVYLLGIKTYYVPSILYSLFNILLFFLSAFIIIPGISTALLTGHVAFSQYSYGRFTSVFSWIYLIVIGLVLLKIDKGSEINNLIKST
ncbi:MAG: hypothetical protein M1331_00375 [Candidatus Marsarchaeota archaeon]|nr:hypothetical protein [Candidatus Marsarchaeota archaeon]